ncbi:MAG: PAS domain-containing protein [Ferrovibrio sp.]
MSHTPEIIDDRTWPALLPPALEDFIAYWRVLASAAGGVPPKAAVDPVRIPPHLLPHIGLVEAQPNGGLESGARLNLRFRLLGTGHRRATGRDYSGRRFDDLYTPEQVLAFEQEYRAILLGGQPSFARRSSLKQNREFIIFQRVLAPLLDECGQPRHVIGYWHWENLES